MTPEEWDAAAVPSRWLSPDEVVLWRGAPLAKLVATPLDAFTCVMAVVWVSAIWFGFLRDGDAPIVVIPFGIGFMCAGLAVSVGRLVLRRRAWRTTLYAVTSLRSVELSSGGTVRTSMLPAVPATCVWRRGGRRADVVWGTSAAWPMFDQVRTLTAGSRLGSHAPRPDQLFANVDDPRGCLVALRQIGTHVEERNATTAVLLPPRPETVAPGGAGAAHGGAVVGGVMHPNPVPVAGPRGRRSWLSERTRRQPWTLRTERSPQDAASRIAAALPAAPPRGSFFGGGFALAPGGVVGAVYQGYVEARSAPVGRNWSLRANLVAAPGGGSVLQGTIGPDVISLFPILFIVVGAILALSSLTAALVNLGSGHGLDGAWFSILFGLAFCGVGTMVFESLYRQGRAGCALVEQTLRAALA